MPAPIAVVLGAGLAIGLGAALLANKEELIAFINQKRLEQRLREGDRLRRRRENHRHGNPRDNQNGYYGTDDEASDGDDAIAMQSVGSRSYGTTRNVEDFQLASSASYYSSGQTSSAVTRNATGVYSVGQGNTSSIDDAYYTGSGATLRNRTNSFGGDSAEYNLHGPIFLGPGPSSDVSDRPTHYYSQRSDGDYEDNDGEDEDDIYDTPGPFADTRSESIISQEPSLLYSRSSGSKNSRTKSGSSSKETPSESDASWDRMDATSVSEIYTPAASEDDYHSVVSLSDNDEFAFRLLNRTHRDAH